MPTKLAWGGGIAAGVDSFLKAYYGALQQERQEKQSQNDKVIGLLMEKMRDEDTPMRKRAVIADEIQRLAMGGKPVKDKKLSEALGLIDDSPLFDQDVDTGETKTVKRKEIYNPGSVPTILPDAQLRGETEFTDMPQMATRDKEVQESVLRKRGDLSKRDFRLIEKRFQDKSEEERSIRLAKVQFDLQEQSFKKLGYEVIDRGSDSKGNRYIVAANKSNDVKIKNLNTGEETNSLPQDFKSERETVAGMRGGLPTTVRAYEEDFKNRKDPATGVNYTTEEARKMAVRKYAEYQESLGQRAEFGATAAGQGTGDLPPSPKMVQEDDRKLYDGANKLMESWRVEYSKWIDNGTLVKGLERNKNEIYEGRDKAKKRADEMVSNEGYAENSKEVQAVRNEYNRLDSSARQAEQEFSQAAGKQNAAFASMNKIAQQARNSPYASKLKIEKDESNGAWFVDLNESSDGMEFRPTGSTNSVKDDVDKALANPQVKALINQLKEKNNGRQLSDRDWYKVAISKGLIKE